MTTTTRLYVVARTRPEAAPEIFAVDSHYAACENVVSQQHSGEDDDPIAIVALDEATASVAAAVEQFQRRQSCERETLALIDAATDDLTAALAAGALRAANFAGVIPDDEAGPLMSDLLDRFPAIEQLLQNL